MEIPVGQGEQTMKWLALVASQRYALKKPSGQRRAREESHAQRGFFIPEEMSTEEGGVCAPNAKICDVLEDGGTVSVKVGLGALHDDVNSGSGGGGAAVATPVYSMPCQ